jgi:hypothetical protein
VEADERVRVLPVPAGMLAPVHQYDVDIDLGQEGVGEGKTAGARSHDQVVGVDVHRVSCHESTFTVAVL